MSLHKKSRILCYMHIQRVSDGVCFRKIPDGVFVHRACSIETKLYLEKNFLSFSRIVSVKIQGARGLVFFISEHALL